MSCCAGNASAFQERDEGWLSSQLDKDAAFYQTLYENGRKQADDGKMASFVVAIVADDDSESKVEGQELLFKSYFETFQFTRADGKYDAKVLDKIELVTDVHDSTNRGGELSTLNKFNGKLLAGDDRTGALFEVDQNNTDPRKRLKPVCFISDGNGKVSKGFKCEWACIKDEKLYIGSHGRPEGTPGLAKDRMRWIKIVDKDWKVKSVNWTSNYAKLSRAVGLTTKPGTSGGLYGYLTHEGALWSDIHQRWFFVPRKIAYHKKYDFGKDPSDHAAILMSCDAKFNDIRIIPYQVEDKVGHGCSDLAFVEGSGDTEIICTRTIETKEITRTWLCVFDITGKMLLDELPLQEGIKYEGVEVL